MKIGYYLIRRVLTVAVGVVFAISIVQSQGQPMLTARYDSADFIRSLPKSASPSLRSFRGLFIEENRISELYPFTTSIFFDAGSAEIPDRYVLFIDPSQTAGYDEKKIPGGTLQKYYQGLNIIGSRLRNHPDQTISIVGCNSHDRAAGETRDLSTQRAKSVHDYLVDIWGIDPARITMLPARDLPKHSSSSDDPDGAAENRRVEMISNSWDMMHTIHQTELRRFPQPEYMEFEMNNGVADSLVVRREIVITRGGKPWYVMTDIGLTDKLSPEYSWGMNGNEDIIPEDEVPYVAQLIVYTDDGQELMSNRVEVPVKIFTRKSRGGDHEHWKKIDRFSLALFSYDNSRLDDISKRALREYVYHDIKEVSNVWITGYTDVIGSDDHNQDLSQRRAASVLGDMQKEIKQGAVASVEAKGVGENSPLYSNDLPEGRFYNRTVQVIVENPREDGW
jgi:outer membrane protein OmpA-like peptidoglycan-associated protein